MDTLTNLIVVVLLRRKITPYFTNLPSVVCQLCLNATGKNVNALLLRDSILSRCLHQSLHKVQILSLRAHLLETSRVPKLSLNNNTSKSSRFMKCVHGHDPILFQMTFSQSNCLRSLDEKTESLKDWLQDLGPANATVRRAHAPGPVAL